MEILCSCQLNFLIWKSRLNEIGIIFLLILSLCWSDTNTFQIQAPDRTADHARSHYKPQDLVPNEILSEGNFTSGDSGVRLVLDLTSSPTEPNQLVTAKTTITTTLPKYVGITEAMFNYTTETSFTTIQEVVYGKNLHVCNHLKFG